MDATESDDSERWEDFFGSSTELAPSLLHIYDSLTAVMKNSHLGKENPSTTNSSETICSLTNRKLNQRKSLLTESTKVSKLYGYFSQEQSNSLKKPFVDVLPKVQHTLLPIQTSSVEVDISEKQIDDPHQTNTSITNQKKILGNQNYKLFSNRLASTSNASSNKKDLISFSKKEETTICNDGVLSEYSKYSSNSHKRNIHSFQKVINAAKIKPMTLKNKDCPQSNISPYNTSKIFKDINYNPLSAASVCSINSISSNTSSSSGTEDFSCKHNTFYLASVESLADQSESELTKLNAVVGLTTSIFERACQEIVDSEKNYVNDLGQVIQGYLRDWKERACLRSNELQVLFSNIESVYIFSLDLLKKLTSSGLNPIKIAKCFIDLREKFDVYTIYCTSYPEAIKLLTKLLQSTHTNALLTSTQKMLQHNLPLGSYLLKPVQRILKYHLLLDNLRKHCNIKEVVQAYEIMRQVARHIDQVKKKLEQQTRVRELSGILDGWLGPELTVLGELRLEGTLMESNKPRKVLLFTTMLIIAKAKEDSRLQFKSYIHQNNLMLSEHLVGELCSFYVIPYDEPRNQIKLTAKNREQKRLWTQQIKSVILEKFDNIPLRAKELVYQLGNDDCHSNSDKISRKWSLNTTSMPTYLERRSQHRRTELRNHSKTMQKCESVRQQCTHNTKDLVTDSLIYMRDDNLSHKISTTTPNNLHQTNFDDFHYELCNNQISAIEKDRKCYECVGSHGQLKRFLSFGPLKVRSKSVPRISFYNVEERNGATIAPSFQSISSKDQTKSMQLLYKQKTLPNRISLLRKYKHDNHKKTSVFYTSLGKLENNETEKILKITEPVNSVTNKDQIVSNESQELHLRNNINANIDSSVTEDAHSECLLMPLHSKCRPDEQIVLDLLKTSKQFDRHCLKLQKLRSEKCNLFKCTQLDLSAIGKGLFIQNESDTILTPRELSRPPKSLENNKEQEFESNEPIYETLLRNVHVPYKFSSRFPKTYMGQQLLAQTNFKKKNLTDTQFISDSTKQKTLENKSNNLQPEADYVTLICSPYENSEKLQSLTNHVKVNAHLVTLSSSSESYIVKDNCSNCNNAKKKQISSTQNKKNTLDSSKIELNATSVKNIHSSCHKGSIERCNFFDKCRLSKLQARSFLDYWRTSQSTQSSLIHLPGSAAVGKRIAYVGSTDHAASLQNSSYLSSYQFCNSRNRNKEPKRHFSITPENINKTYKMMTNQKLEFDYEECVEACLEQEYRDSAVYSDDSDHRDDLPIIDNLYDSIDNTYN